jgi:hypothetical protein
MMPAMGAAEQWFKLADEDKDGVISGPEAVRFFTKSGLPQNVLGQVRVRFQQAMWRMLQAVLTTRILRFSTSHTALLTRTHL